MSNDITYIPGKYLDSVPETVYIFFVIAYIVDKLIGDSQVHVIMNDDK